MFYPMLFWEYLKNYAKTRLTYRADFWLEVLSDLLFQGVNLIFILIAFQHTDALQGWTQNEVVFVYGYFMIAFGFFGCFFNLWGFSERYIVKGEMDRVLIRPAHNLMQIMLENMDPPSLFGSLTGLIIMLVSGWQLGLDFGWLDGLMLVLLVAGSVLIYFGVYVSLTAIAFYSDSPTGILPLMYNIQTYGRYPVGIYNRAIRFVLTWLIPFAFVGVYPASYFLNRAGSEEAGLALLTPVVGIVFATAGLLIWNHGVKRYRGAGS